MTLTSPTHTGTAGTAIRRGGLALADQAVTSLSSLLLLSLVARNVPAARFGEFVLLYGYYVLVCQLVQTTVAEPALVRFPRDDRAGAELLRDMTGLALLAAAVAAVVLVPFSELVLGSLDASTFAMAAALPALLMQDALRMGLIAAGQAGRALLNDVLLIALQSVAVIAVLRCTTQLHWLVVGWGAAGIVAALVGLGQARVLPRCTAIRQWWRDYGDLASPYLAEAVALVASSYGALVVVASICDPAVAGSLRALELVFGPVSLLIFAGRRILIAELARLIARSQQRLVRTVALASLAVGGICGGYGVVVMALPADLGRNLLGDSWAAVVALLPWYVLCRVVQGATVAPSAALRALEAVRTQFWIRITAAVLTFTLCVAGAATAGARGAVTGLLAAAVVVFAATHGGFTVRTCVHNRKGVSNAHSTQAGDVTNTNTTVTNTTVTDPTVTDVSVVHGHDTTACPGIAGGDRVRASAVSPHRSS